VQHKNQKKFLVFVEQIKIMEIRKNKQKKSTVQIKQKKGKLSYCAVCGVRCAVCGVRCAVCGVRCANLQKKSEPCVRIGVFFSFCFALFIGANVGLFFDILAEKKSGGFGCCYMKNRNRAC
jgi:hypothetical protein